ncbi:hypothetical protein ACTTAI_16260 [Rhodobacter capsulatus]|uniref:hypothetical protein n=1 Tax=Rhodobacter capsulatus TaxID=1061 RepID=UPI00402814FB
MKITITENLACDPRVRFRCAIDEGAGFEGRGETRADALYQTAFSMRRQELADAVLQGRDGGEG